MTDPEEFVYFFNDLLAMYSARLERRGEYDGGQSYAVHYVIATDDWELNLDDLLQ